LNELKEAENIEEDTLEHHEDLKEVENIEVDTSERHEDRMVGLHMRVVKPLNVELEEVDNKVVGKFLVLIKVVVDLELVGT
jgi:hypothetical protein